MKSLNSFTRIKIEGLNQIKLLTFIKNNDIDVFNVQFLSKSVMEFDINSNKLKKLKKIFKNKSINYQILGNTGVCGILYLLLNNIGIIISILFFIIFVLIFNNFLFNIKVQCSDDVMSHNVEEYVGEYLKQSNYLKSKVDTSEIEKLIYTNFDKVSLVSAIKKGGFVVIDIKQMLDNNETTTEENFTPATSSVRGYVQSIQVFQGMPQVKVGDFVDVGDVLISQIVYDSKGNKQFVVPKGKVEIKCYIDDCVTHCPSQIIFERTGKTAENCNLSFLGINISNQQSDITFDKFESETKETIISQNNILPLVYSKTIFYELKEVVLNVNFDDVKNDLLKKAKQNAYQKVPNNAIITNEHENIYDSHEGKVVQYVYECLVNCSF